MMKKNKPLIYCEEYPVINGIKQYLFHSGTNADNPVMLFLHGGPGFAESTLSYLFQEEWEQIYTVVHWDQRGAGKTLTKNRRQSATVELLLQDLFEIIKYLKKRYKKRKIVLMAHSWGTILGSLFIQRYPEDIAYYIVTGQVINMFENERVGYEKVKELAVENNDKRSLKMLDSLGEYPGSFHGMEFKNRSEKLRSIQGKYHLAAAGNFSVIRYLLKSPIFKLSDILALMKMDRVNKETIEYWSRFDLNLEPKEYRVPVYYILGENDWQTLYILAEKYFAGISAPRRRNYLLKNAGHMAMLDQPVLFFKALLDIYRREK